jgi:hypothetical protein
MHSAVDERQLEAMIAAGAGDVVETMFFTSVVDPAEVCVDLGDPEEVSLAVAFHGTPSGRLAMHMTRQTAHALVASFLGVGKPGLARLSRFTS